MHCLDSVRFVRWKHLRSPGFAAQQVGPATPSVAYKIVYSGTRWERQGAGGHMGSWLTVALEGNRVVGHNQQRIGWLHLV
jgi:hypothetical protein